MSEPSSERIIKIQDLAKEFSDTALVSFLTPNQLRIQFDSSAIPGKFWAKHWERLCKIGVQQELEQIQICSSNDSLLPGYVFNPAEVLEHGRLPSSLIASS